ncbi:MAG TPA: glycosyltransferase [Prolixibacteraceae bacterium]|nr:glycosyltransferase [Prolixibacteraceae bacterium]
MEKLIVIIPVKDSMDTVQRSIDRVCAAEGMHSLVVYNDFSTPANRAILEKISDDRVHVVHLEDRITSPSPNYRYVLQDARKRALDEKAHLVIVESDVFIHTDTLLVLSRFTRTLDRPGMIAAITTDADGTVNFPYKPVRQKDAEYISTRHRLSFCCTLLTHSLLLTVDFDHFPPNRDWYDVFVSTMSRKKGFRNYLLPKTAVIHEPHSSRPWKKEKYIRPVAYYLKKWVFKRDRI